MSCGGQDGVIWNWPCPAQGSPGLPSQTPPAAPKAWAPTACSVNQDWYCPIAVVSDSSSFLLLFPWFRMHVLGSCPIERQDSALHTMSISSCATGGDSGPWLKHTVMKHATYEPPQSTAVLISFYIFSADSAERSYPERPWRYISLKNSAVLETAELSCLSQ